MSKVIFDTEVVEILRGIVYHDGIDDSDTYREFLTKLGHLITEYCGGEVVTVSAPAGDGEINDRYAIHLGWTDSVPQDGGVYANFDIDKTLVEWEEEGRGHYAEISN